MHLQLIVSLRHAQPDEDSLQELQLILYIRDMAILIHNQVHGYSVDQ
jgi:hypothetical protein